MGVDGVWGGCVGEEKRNLMCKKGASAAQKQWVMARALLAVLKCGAVRCEGAHTATVVFCSSRATATATATTTITA